MIGLKQSPVIFDEENHTYHLGDKRLLGITGLIHSVLGLGVYPDADDCITKAMRLLGVDRMAVTPNNSSPWLFEPCNGIEIIVMPRSKYLSNVKASAKINLIKKPT